MLVEIKTGEGTRCGEFTLISHRGGKGFGPENTLQSLHAAVEFGVEMVETDVRMSGDGVPVILHSPFIGLRLVSRMALEEIREKAPDTPTLREYLEVGGMRCAMNLEIKKCDPATLAETIEDASPALPVLVTSFDADFLSDFAKTGSGARTGLLGHYEPSPQRMLDEARRCGASLLLPASFSVREAFMEAAREAGLGVITWTVNSTAVLLDMLAAGVDGVITDTYPQLKSFLEAGMAVLPRERAAACHAENVP